MANDIICEISSENELICEMSSAGEIVVEINGMTYQSVAAELAEKASVEDVALKADKTYVDSQDELKADKTYVDSQDALKADKTYVDSQDELKADKLYVDEMLALKANDATTYTKVETDGLMNAVEARTETELNKKALATNGGALQTVTGKNKFYPLLSNISGQVIVRQIAAVGENDTGTEGYGVGDEALSRNTGTYANGFGYYALSNNTGTYANGFGYAALQNNTGTYASGFGHAALRNNTGTYSSGFGYDALRNNTGAYANGFGYAALQSNTGTSANGFGMYALSRNTGTYANGFGYAALQNNTGNNNSAFGHNANNTTDAIIQALSNTTCLGANTLPNKSNQVVLGNGSVDTVKMGGTARTPASSTAPGVKGETCWDTNYFYICVATNIWKRIPMEVW